MDQIIAMLDTTKQKFYDRISVKNQRYILLSKSNNSGILVNFFEPHAKSWNISLRVKNNV